MPPGPIPPLRYFLAILGTALAAIWLAFAYPIYRFGWWVNPEAMTRWRYTVKIGEIWVMLTGIDAEHERPPRLVWFLSTVGVLIIGYLLFSVR